MSSSSSSSTSGLTLTLLPHGDTGTRVRWRSLEVSSANGKLYGAPYDNVDKLIVIDPDDDSIDTTLSTASISSGAKRWVDGTALSDGRIFFNSASAAGHLVVDTNPATPTLTQYGAIAYQCRGSVLADNGKIYSSVYQDFDYLRTYDTSTNALSTVAYTRDAGPPSWTEGSMQDKLAGYHWGMAKAPNTGKLYGVPWGPHKVMVVEPTTDTVTWTADNVTGNTTVGTIGATPAYFGKYGGKGTYVPSNQCIYIMPRSGNAILKINTLTDALTEIPLPAVLQARSEQRSMSSFLGPDGNVYSTPWSMPYLFWIDPDTDTIDYMDISATMSADGGGERGTGYWTYAAVSGNDAYVVAGGALNVLKISFPETSTSASDSASSISSSFGSSKSYSSVSESSASSA